MPVWSLEELKAVQAAMNDNNVTKEDVYLRYYTVGGIIRSVLEPDKVIYNDYLKRQSFAIQSTPRSMIYKEGSDIDEFQDNITHFVLQYDVDTTNFRNYVFQFSAPFVRKVLNELNDAKDLQKMKEVMLRFQMRTDVDQKSVYKLFE